jgi:hypothetical protein
MNQELIKCAEELERIVKELETATPVKVAEEFSFGTVSKTSSAAVNPLLDFILS